MKLRLLAALIFLLTSADAVSYARPESVSLEQWAEIQPYLLPQNHPIRSKLDKIFAKPGVTQSPKSLKAAKFKLKKRINRHPDNVYVATHPALKKYLVKVYTDGQRFDELSLFMHRIKGANLIRAMIDRDHLHHLFVVPRKWIYPIPGSKSGSKRFVLVADKISILSPWDNEVMWEQNNIFYDHLYHLRKLLLEGGLYDCVYITNIPFTKDRKIAFIDTETYHRWPIRHDRIRRWLSKDNARIWESLGWYGEPF